MAVAITIHLFAVLLWVGGMFFAYVILRPSAAALLEPPQRLPLWVGVFSRFFPWVWASIIALPISGYWMISQVFGGFAGSGLYIHAMHALGLLMIGIFLAVFFKPYKGLKSEVSAQNFPAAAKHLNNIRRLVGLNLLLGIITILIASIGRYSYA